MPEPWSDLLSCLDLKPDASGAGFEARNQALTYHRVFGGQILAQFLRAAALTCPGKQPKSLHVLFPSEGRSEEPIHYEVERQKEGGTFATLAVTARQSAGVIASALVSMSRAEDGPATQSVGPVPAVLPADAEAGLELIPWETRSRADLNARDVHRPEAEIWMRTPEVDPELAVPLTAYATDLTLIGTALRAVDGVSQLDAQQRFVSAVTSHTLWFHRPFRTDSWLLLRQEGPILAHGRGFGRGDVLTEDGTLVASFAQESMVRFRS
jgi:acyl-CoA thioesterase